MLDWLDAHLCFWDLPSPHLEIPFGFLLCRHSCFLDAMCFFLLFHFGEAYPPIFPGERVCGNSKLEILFFLTSEDIVPF